MSPRINYTPGPNARYQPAFIHNRATIIIKALHFEVTHPLLNQPLTEPFLAWIAQPALIPDPDYFPNTIGLDRILEELWQDWLAFKAGYPPTLPEETRDAEVT